MLDMDSTEVPVYGRQEQSAYNGHFESTCYHPLLLFNRAGDCLAAKLLPGNVHSAVGWQSPLGAVRLPREKTALNESVFERTSDRAGTTGGQNGNSWLTQFLLNAWN
jgi:Transposase DDE domain group 1